MAAPEEAPAELGCGTPSPAGPATLRCREELAKAIRTTPRAVKRPRVASGGVLREARCGRGVARALHDLVAVLRSWSTVVDSSLEVCCTAQRMVDCLCGPAAPQHYGAALMLATKLVSTQYCLLPASWVAHALGVTRQDVLDAELQLCLTAGWSLQRFARGT